MYEQMAESMAAQAGNRTGDEKQTDAIGEGLAAVAYALLEVARAIREAGEQHRTP
nr:hypothetical protein [Micromonospora sp. DSM 115978]